MVGRLPRGARGCDTNTYPVIAPVSTVVLQADTRNVDGVIVAGTLLKRDRRLVGADLARPATGGDVPDYLLGRTQVQPHRVQSRAATAVRRLVQCQ